MSEDTVVRDSDIKEFRISNIQILVLIIVLELLWKLYYKEILNITSNFVYNKHIFQVLTHLAEKSLLAEDYSVRWSR